jgi:DNA invertase Pin-like site-specific DNA recombinase
MVRKARFQRLVAEVGLGKAGGVFGLEASRLARNNRDWYLLLDLCAFYDTLIIDFEGIYSPRVMNDRLLLGLKGTISEAELSWIRMRAEEGLKSKARRGELFTCVPVGYVRTNDDRLEKVPDERVQEALGSVFDKFNETGSVRQTLLYFRHKGISLPVWQHTRWGWQTRWRLPVYNTILALLTNPTYGGAYAWGRTETRVRMEGGRTHKTGGHNKAIEQWNVLIQDHHEGYISWGEHRRIVEKIRQNAAMKGLMTRGAIKRGPSLVAGLLRCQRCGRMLHVGYGSDGGTVLRYECKGAHINHGVEGRCTAIGGRRVDEVVSQEDDHDNPRCRHRERDSLAAAVHRVAP